MAATVDMKLLRATKFPPEFNQKVDMQKVNLQVMKKWIAGKLSEILGSEDDVVTELCFNLIEGTRFPDIKSMQIQLTGFLEKETPSFCKELWNLFLSAQSSPQGVPQELLEAKKLELIQEKISQLEAEKAAEEARLRRENQDRRNRDLNDTRDRERRDRGFRGEAALGAAEIDHRPVLLLGEPLTVEAATATDTYHKAGVAAIAGAPRHVQYRPTHEALGKVRGLGLAPVVWAIEVAGLADQAARRAVLMHREGRRPVIGTVTNARGRGDETITGLVTPVAKILLRPRVGQIQMVADGRDRPNDADTRSLAADRDRRHGGPNAAIRQDHLHPLAHPAAVQEDDQAETETLSVAVLPRIVMVG
ncbi:hypothetical protein TruAng_011249 [Truncatella angustata]|nr:hypothetical protein TruAng_011249 [Truncatella angustata]